MVAHEPAIKRFDLSKEKTMNKNLFKAITLFFVFAFVLGCDMRSPDEKAIDAVKNGTLGGYEQTTVGRAFESVLGDARWRSFETEKGVRVVALIGNPSAQFLPARLYKPFCYDQSRYSIVIKFNLRITDDHFEIASCGFGKDISFNCDEFIRHAYGSNTSYEPVNCDVFGEFTDSRDGRTYKTSRIGNQVWMSENLNYKTQDSYCANNSETENCDIYGRLYTWNAAIYACPEGWHLPSDNEFKSLIAAVGGKEKANIMLKSTTGWKREDLNGIDAYGFSALPAGGSSGFFGNNFGGSAFFWSMMGAPPDGSFYRMYLDYLDYGDVGLAVSSQDKLSSVRCVKN